MGIVINMNISKSVTKKEWESVYNETLLLVDKLPFAERISKNIHGIDTICLVRTKERTDRYGLNKAMSRTGWFTEGDYIYMDTAEDYFLPRDLVKDNEVDDEAGMQFLEIFQPILIMTVMMIFAVVRMKYGAPRLKVKGIICFYWR